MQTSLAKAIKLQQLVHAADNTASNSGFMQALRRRISQSLYLQTVREAQLHAALIAVTTDEGAGTMEACRTMTW